LGAAVRSVDSIDLTVSQRHMKMVWPSSPP
jgi:hypothetical protein